MDQLAELLSVYQFTCKQKNLHFSLEIYFYQGLLSNNCLESALDFVSSEAQHCSEGLIRINKDDFLCQNSM